MTDQIMKPSLGLRPRFVVQEERINEIITAMHRYATTEQKIPIEWINELDETFKHYQGYRMQVRDKGSLHEAKNGAAIR